MAGAEDVSPGIGRREAGVSPARRQARRRRSQEHPFLDFVAVLAINSAAAIKLSRA